MNLMYKSNYVLGKILQKTWVQCEDKFANFQFELNEDNIKDLEKIVKGKNIKENMGKNL